MTALQASYIGMFFSLLFGLFQAGRDAWYFLPSAQKAAVVRWAAIRCTRASAALTRAALRFQQLGAQLDAFARDLDRKGEGDETVR